MILRRQLATWGSSLRDLVYPPRCLACRGEMNEFEPTRFCLPCLEEMSLFGDTLCQRCGAPDDRGEAEQTVCPHCRHLKFRFDRAVALGEYRGLLRQQVLLTKRPIGEVVAMALAHLLIQRQGAALRQEPCDVVCSVPMHWRRRLVRQASGPDLLGEIVARELKVPFAPTLLRRRRSTTPQFELPVGRRRLNVRGAFALGRGHSLNSAHVLLVDDILTTGATCSEIARVLKQRGADRVTVAVLARSFSGS